MDEGIIEIKDSEQYELDIYPPIRINKKEYYLGLASKEDGSCIFLRDDGKCVVHEFKPLVCRFYPFVYWVKEDGGIDIDLNEKAMNECPGLILDGELIDRGIVESLKRIALIRRAELKLWSEAINEWNKYYGDKSCHLSLFLKFALEKAEIHRKVLVEHGLWTK